MSLKDWSTTAASNNAAAPYGAPEGLTLANVNNVMRQMMADTRTLAAADTIAASAGATDIGTKDATILTLTGTAVTITGWGTVSAGIYKFIIYNAAHTLTYNATSMILLGNASRTVAAGDVSLFVSEGSGNWREVMYSPDAGYQPLDAELTALAGLTSAANKVPRFTGSGTAEVIDVDYGTWTPTLTAGTNCEAITVSGLWYYTRLGNIVTVSGRFTFDPLNPEVSVVWYATLPIASGFTLSTDAAGVVADHQRGAGTVYADETNDRLIFAIESGTYASVTTAGFTAQYIIK